MVSDMWRPYLAVVRKSLPQAVQILNRFHLTALMNQAVDQVRRGEGHALRDKRRGERLKQTRWLLPKLRVRVRGKARERLEGVLHSRLKTARAWTLKEVFAHFSNTAQSWTTIVRKAAEYVGDTDLNPRARQGKGGGRGARARLGHTVLRVGRRQWRHRRRIGHHLYACRDPDPVIGTARRPIATEFIAAIWIRVDSLARRRNDDSAIRGWPHRFLCLFRAVKAPRQPARADEQYTGKGHSAFQHQHEHLTTPLLAVSITSFAPIWLGNQTASYFSISEPLPYQPSHITVACNLLAALQRNLPAGPAQAAPITTQ